jgi:hypothetical protein
MTTLSEPRDRLASLLVSGTINGIDYVELIPGVTNQLRVHFLNAVQPLTALLATITGGDVVPTVPVAPINPTADWSLDQDGRPLLTLNLLILNLPQGVSDFSTYTLTLAAAATNPGEPTKLDPQYTSIGFSFKTLCPSAFDCAAPVATCPPDDTAPPAIDYTAKDFGSFVQALSAFSAQAYPTWQERSEADLGVVVMEALAALADELSYYQDRVAVEAGIETATQRRSLVSLARLVDYEPAPVQSAQATLLCAVASTVVPAGARVSAVGPNGTIIPFEIGAGLNDTTNYQVSPGWNFPIPAYWWDDAERCLPAGATEMWVLGDTHGFVAGMRLLIQTDLPGESLRQIVTLIETGETSQDSIFLQNGSPTPVTRITWGASDALTQERNLTVTNVGGNLLPATQGQRYAESFAIDTPPAGQPGMPLAIARRGPNATDANPNWIYRRPLANSPVAWLPPPPAIAADPLVADNALAPEIILTPAPPGAARWTFAQSLLIAAETETAFTIDPVAWRAVVTNPDGTVANYEMDGDGGDSLRFGDNVFGASPQSGEIFNLLYRVSLGAAGNVPADSVTVVDPNWGGILLSASNPMPATGGSDAESTIHIRRMAPQRFRAVQLRAIRPEDYVAAAETLPWVKQAGSAFRWTGSWLSVFTVADPGGTETITPDQQVAISELLNRRKLAGYESFAPAPDYASLDLAVDLCAAVFAFGPDVEQAVLAALGATNLTTPGTTAFFANRFSFGTPLYRSALEAAIQAVPGVNGVLAISYRQRGVTSGWLDMPAVFPLGANQILRIDNNPDYPERGTIQVTAEGGR